tara:strand:+ start:162 stop:746 length:585 start_codon:yes stop_codon:yes gene_type:complete
MVIFDTIKRRSRPFLAVLAISSASMVASPASASGFSLDGTIWDRTANEFGLDSYLLYAVALVESAKLAGKSHARPFPLALHTPDGAVYPSSEDEALAIIRGFTASNQDLKRVDVGVMQINAGWHGQRVNSVEDLLHFETNVRVGAEILSETLRSSPDDIVIGVGRYHNWGDDRARAYGMRVMSVWSRLVLLAKR